MTIECFNHFLMRARVRFVAEHVLKVPITSTLSSNYSNSVTQFAHIHRNTAAEWHLIRSVCNKQRV